jgi:hypothetical protein
VPYEIVFSRCQSCQASGGTHFRALLFLSDFNITTNSTASYCHAQSPSLWRDMHTSLLDFESNSSNNVPTSAQRYVPRTKSARGRPNAGAEMSSSRHRAVSSKPPLSITCRSRQNSHVKISATLDLQRSSGQISNRSQKAERQGSLKIDCSRVYLQTSFYLVQVPSQDCTNYTYRLKGAEGERHAGNPTSRLFAHARFAACVFNRSTTASLGLLTGSRLA